MAASTTRPCAATSLAPELLHIIFAPLSQPGILTVAAVCSWWRACAIEHPIYYRAGVFDIPTGTLSSLNYGRGYEILEKLERFVREAEIDSYNIGLSVSIHLGSGYGGGSPIEDHDSIFGSSDDSDEESTLARARTETYRTTLEARLVPLLRRALVRCVVLKVSWDAPAAEIIWKALSFPAYVLRRLNISGDSALIPARFLSADAPRLTDVSLVRVGVSDLSPCFPSVRTLLLDCPVDLTHLSTARTAFPGTKHLTIQCLGLEIEPSNADYTMFAGLDSLLLGPEHVDLPTLLPAAHIPLIEYCGPCPYDFSELLPSSGEASAHIFEYPCERSTFATQHRQICLDFRSGGLIRRVDCDLAFLTTCDFVALGQTLHYVTDLTIDDQHVRTLFETWACLPALRTLRITLVTWAPGVPPADEKLVYATDHERSTCKCLGGLFGDKYDGSCPDGDVRIELAALETLELRATRPNAAVPPHSLRALSRSFGCHVHLILSNGLSILDELDAQPLFASITSSDACFCATLPDVVRAVELLDAAASKRKIVLQDMDDALRTYGPEFHWNHCLKAEASD